MSPSDRFVALGLAALLLSPGPAQADEILYPSAGLAMPLNDSGVTARALALGSAYTGLAEGASALFWNPGGLAFLDCMELGFHHDSGPDGLTRETGLWATHVDGWGAYAASVDTVNDGTFQGRDAYGNPTNAYTAGDLGTELGWAWHGTRGLGLGISAGFTDQTLANNSYEAYSAGLGALWKPMPTLSLGVDLANLGPEVSGSPQTASLNLGGDWKFGAGNDNQALVTLGFKDEFGGVQVAESGFEDELFSLLALRFGYQYDFSPTDLNGLNGVTAGLGISVHGFSVDYAYLPFGQLGSSQTLSLTYRFPPSGRPRPRRKKRYPDSAKQRASLADGLTIRILQQRLRVRKNPSDSAAWWTLGNLFYQEQDFQKANALCVSLNETVTYSLISV